MPIIPADRNFTWNPGMMSKGGISTRNTIFTTLTPNGTEDTSQIQTALDNCPAGQVVLLSAGTFKFSTVQTPLIIHTGITLRGSGAGVTFLQKVGAGAAQPRLGTLVGGTTIPYPVGQSGLDNAPIILVGPGRFAGVDNNSAGSSSPGSSKNLTVDGVAGTSSVTVSDGSIYTIGHCVLLDELTVPSYIATPRGFLDNNTNGTEGTVQVLSGDRIVMNRHKTGSTIDSQTFQDDPPDAWGYFSRAEPVTAATSAYTDGRLVNEIKKISGIAGNVITFESPLTITYRTTHTAQLTTYTSTPGTGNSVHLEGAGVEKLTVQFSGGGGIFFNCAAYCWASNVELNQNFGLGIALANSYRCEIRDSYIHTSAQPTPAADSYAINLLSGTSEILIENNIMRDYCKVTSARACGAGSVWAYNYCDDGWDWYDAGASNDALTAQFQECGLNNSHMGGGHHALFEGNWGFNSDSDYTHGNSIYITYFRNWLTGKRTHFGTEDGARCGGGAMFSYFMTYVGNVLGRSGAMSGWTYTDARMGADAGGLGNNFTPQPTSGWTNSLFWNNNSIWKIGYDPERWPCNADAATLSELIRDGNYDYVTNSQKWHTTPATFVIPSSLYLSSKPSFFGSNPWPWVNPATGVTSALPAKARFDAGIPNNTNPSGGGGTVGTKQLKGIKSPDGSFYGTLTDGVGNLVVTTTTSRSLPQQVLRCSLAPDGSQYMTLTDGVGNLV